MRIVTSIFIIVTVLSLAPAVSPPSALTPQGDTIIVASAADSGTGTLRQALEEAQRGDTITFNSIIFPPIAAVTISITSELLHIHQGNLTIDASNAGVILDGSSVPGAWVSGLQIVSHGNTIQGLQVSNFSGTGIAISDGAYNLIGGDRSVGAGPFGQGNLTIHNDIGIGMWGTWASFNTIRGNLIGSRASGVDDLGNHRHGIIVQEGSSNNTIGPDNLIAYNGGHGIEIPQNPDSLYNTISQNSIHDNGWNGIYLWPTSNGKLARPVILDYDLQAGTMTGITCVNCTVEIFSDSNDEGEIYEGQTTANSAGIFTFNKGYSFAGPHLTSTATDTDGNTSEFSQPTAATSGSLILQGDNSLPKTPLGSRQSGDLDDNRIGSHWQGLWAWHDPFSHLLNETLYLGVKRYRLSINNGDEDKVDWSRSEFSVDPSHDEFITDLANNGIQITYFLSFWDKATWPGGVGAPCPRFKTEEEIQRYLEFVRFIVGHFKDRIQTYDIYNEPDNTACPQWIEVEDYINLVRRTIPVIREEYPEAKIQVGSTAGLSNPDSRAYLFGILESDIMPLVDVIAWHPFYGDSPEYHPGYYYAYPSLVQNIKDTASNHGFTGEYEGDEMDYRPDSEADPTIPYTFSEPAAAKYHARGTLMNIGMDVIAGHLLIPHASAIRTFTVRNLSTVMVGAEPISLPLTIQTTATNVVSYTFALPDDGRLIALWTDGIAVDYDPGVTTTVTISGFADHAVMGIDVLNGFQQQMITDTVDGNLVIRDLLVKDYPLILRLYTTKYVFLPIVLNGHPH